MMIKLISRCEIHTLEIDHLFSICAAEASMEIDHLFNVFVE